MVSILTNQVAIMLLLILAGMLCYRLHLLTDRGVKELSGIVLQVVNPIVILLAYHRELELRLVQSGSAGSPDTRRQPAHRLW